LTFDVSLWVLKLQGKNYYKLWKNRHTFSQFFHWNFYLLYEIIEYSYIMPNKTFKSANLKTVHIKLFKLMFYE
jgi:hypothetical protein